KDLYIQKVAYDTWNATQWAINATDAGLNLEPFSQSLGNFNRPTKEFERLMLSGKIVLDNNVINRHCLRNVVLVRDRNDNVKPSKGYGEDKKVDGVIAMLQAMGVFLLTPRYGEFY
ncbi:MAG: terminase large subunit, partial [Paludibacteraceae bacterium]|nr:terminase large subunit [Paludibacteraceae bacterium]